MPIFQASNDNNLPASGFGPHSTSMDPMTNRGGAHFQGPSPRPRGPWITRGPRGRGRGYQAQQGYRQLVPYTPIRNQGRPRGRGSRGVIFSNQRQPNPNPTPITSSNVAQNPTGGESIELQGFFTKRSTAMTFEERKRDRLTDQASNVPGPAVK